jgi:serine/threonine protein kinase
MVKKIPDDTSQPAGKEDEPAADQTDVAAAKTVVHESKAAEHVSDVVLAESESLEVSDVVLAESETVRAPTFREPHPLPSALSGLPPTIELRPDEKQAARDEVPMALLPGAKVDDFEVVRLLGRGAFGHVYLARQLSLDRLVALKVSANRGSEGRTMARLEHQHIVQVFSEKVDPDFNQRLLCMQLVPGVGLDKLIVMLHDAKAGSREQGAGGKDKACESTWTGAELIGFIDRSGSLPTTLDPAALHDREALARMDAVEATAWFGGRMAEALDFAHGHGVLHRDIKPANILVNPYGRPMLADFNISSQPIGSEKSGDEMFGGTFAYMAPEHLDAFNPDDDTGHEVVTPRSDIYSLGLVLQQLLDGQMTFALARPKGKMGDRLRTMADERRKAQPICKVGHPGAHMTLERTIGRCLEPKPIDRFATGAELAEQLDGCRHLREAEHRLPGVPAMFAPILRRPFLWIVLLVVLPQIAASVVNIAYNTTQIVTALSDAQKDEFKRLVAGYNAIVYPVAILAFVLTVLPIWRCWRALSRAERLPDGDVKAVRLRALRLTRFIAILTAIGWFPGGFIFPLVIQLTSGLDFEIAVHFVASFCLSGLIALSYSLCGVEFVVLRGLYPSLWQDARHFTAVAREELAPVSRQLNRIELLAVAMPLVAAICLNLLASETDQTLRLLVTALIFLGIIGITVTGKITRYLYEVLVALTNTKA